MKKLPDKLLMNVDTQLLELDLSNLTSMERPLGFTDLLRSRSNSMMDSSTSTHPLQPYRPSAESDLTHAATHQPPLWGSLPHTFRSRIPSTPDVLLACTCVHGWDTMYLSQVTSMV